MSFDPSKIATQFEQGYDDDYRAMYDDPSALAPMVRVILQGFVLRNSTELSDDELVEIVRLMPTHNLNVRLSPVCIMLARFVFLTLMKGKLSAE